MINTSGVKRSKIKRILLAPINILSKGTKFYTKSMLNCAGWLGYDTGPVGDMDSQLSDLPRSFSINSYTSSAKAEEYRMLLREVSRMSSEMNLEDLQRRSASTTMGSSGMVIRSYSVGIGKIGRIDEERPCSFREDDVVVEADAYPRSRSAAVRR